MKSESEKHIRADQSDKVGADFDDVIIIKNVKEEFLQTELTSNYSNNCENEYHLTSENIKEGITNQIRCIYAFYKDTLAIKETSNPKEKKKKELLDTHNCYTNL